MGSLGGGHYTANCKAEDGEWYCFDDARVTKISSSRSIVTPEAYVLYFVRQAGANGTPCKAKMPSPVVAGGDGGSSSEPELE